MSLTGNLEDLPLLDIIQIVSFSKKTGYLTIRTPSGEGAIVFSDGSVVSGFTWTSPPVGPEMDSQPVAQRDLLLRRRIGGALEQLVRLREGQFDFSLTPEPPEIVGGRDITRETVSVGINPQELLLDLARGMDEDRRDSSAALEASFAQPGDEEDEVAATAAETPTAEGPPPAAADAEIPPSPAPQPPVQDVVPEAATPASPAPPPVPEAAAATPPEGTEPIKTILLVDDEDDVRRLLAERFTSGGFTVHDAGSPGAAAKQAQLFKREGVRFVLVTDLGMPTTGGGSFQGGFEVVKRLWKMNLKPQVLMMTDRLNSSIRSRARQMGIARFVFKPGLSKLDHEQFESDLHAFAAKLLSDVLPSLAQPALAGSSASTPSRRRSVPSVLDARETSEELRQLQRRLQELRRPGDASRISQLVMTMAQEVFERGILFLVKGEQLRGLGGFGSGPKDEKLNLLVRDVTIPLGEPSVFHDVVVGRKPWSGKLPTGKWSQHLMGKIGAFRSSSVALFPLVTHRETMALLFGDNPETGSDIGRLDVLDVFVNQAGVALENSFLQRKLAALEQK